MNRWGAEAQSRAQGRPRSRGSLGISIGKQGQPSAYWGAATSRVPMGGLEGPHRPHSYLLFPRGPPLGAHESSGPLTVQGSEDGGLWEAGTVMWGGASWGLWEAPLVSQPVLYPTTSLASRVLLFLIPKLNQFVLQSVLRCPLLHEDLLDFPFDPGVQLAPMAGHQQPTFSLYLAK